jgi:glycosyltransferase involved in cell wall biosynthesis
MFEPPVILPVPVSAARPKWSVMIPTFNGTRYLQQTLESVLAQDQGADNMQIEVIDDCSTTDDPEAIVKRVGQGRISFYRNPKNRGAISNFNACVERSRGHLIHILHQDDSILPGFYDYISRAATKWPDVALYATRAFVVEEDANILGLTDRIPSLELPSNDIKPFLYGTPIRTPAVVVRRDAYERFGGFCPEFVLLADCEMWLRAIEKGRGVICPAVLCNHRSCTSTETSRLQRLGEAALDIERLNTMFAAKYPTFNVNRGARRVYETAYADAKLFERLGNIEAAEVNWRIWRDRVSLTRQLLRSFRICIREFISLATLFYSFRKGQFRDKSKKVTAHRDQI